MSECFVSSRFVVVMFCSEKVYGIVEVPKNNFKQRMLEKAMYIILISILVALDCIRTLVADPNCPNQEDFSNCTCSNGNETNCDRIPIDKIAQIFMGASTFQEPVFFSLTFEPTDISIPDDLMGAEKFASQLNFKCPSNTYKVQISKNAFRSSQNYTTALRINSCNFEFINFVFLTSFNFLSTIHFKDGVGLQFSLQSLPNPLPNLRELLLDAPTSFNKIINFPVLSSGLRNFIVEGGIEDGALSRFLDWVSISSNSTLKILVLRNNNGLTKVPSQIAKFTTLQTIDLLGNQITTIPSNAMSFFVPNSSISLSRNAIHTIEPYTFSEGNFTSARVDLSVNNLTKFESSVFEELLKQVEPAGLWLYGNQFNCSDVCELAWIARDDRALLDKIEGGSCSNGQQFKDLDPRAFLSCPVKIETTTMTTFETTSWTTVEATTILTTTKGNDSCVFVAHPLDKDFTDGALSPWFDDSIGDAAWLVDDSYSLKMGATGKHKVEDGQKHLRLKLRKESAFGVAVLRSPNFMAHPNQTITFSYFIRSQLKQFNNLQVFWCVDECQENLLIELYPNSLPGNNQWRTISTTLPVQSSTKISLVFYGFSGAASDNLSAIAIDNISLSQSCLF